MVNEEKENVWCLQDSRCDEVKLETSVLVRNYVIAKTVDGEDGSSHKEDRDETSTVCVHLA